VVKVPGAAIDVKNRTIQQLMTEVNSEKFLLPSFPSQYVWDEDDIRDLIDSLVNNCPIGTMILWGMCTALPLQATNDRET